MKPAPVKPDVTFDDLQKLDIRVGTIESVTDVEGSKKLVKLIVNFGDHSRTILAGIKQEREDPSEITGKQALFVINVPPRRMAGAIYTQVGSSLAGSAVQGAIVSEAAAEYSKGLELPKISKDRMKAIEEEILAPLKRKAGYGPAWVTQALQGIMIPNFVLYIKKESLLKAALAYVEELRDHHMPMLRAADLHELRLAHETSNMIINAEMKLKASLMRKESRCSHYRLDYPDPDTKDWNAWINIYKGRDGEMKLEKQAFDSWPA